MDLTTASAFFGWCSVINIGILIYWAAVVLWAPNWVFQWSNRFFTMTQEQFTVIQYCFMGAFKLIILLTNIVPYFALRIIA